MERGVPGRAMRVAEAVGRTLADRGAGVFFGLIGSGNFAVASALQATGAAFYSSRHECGAVMMAEGYARTSGEVGVCTVHQGPGFTNALTGLVEAAKSRTPVLLLAADTPPGTLWSNFKIDQAALSEAASAISEKVRSLETAATDAARALRRARVERRPVVLNVPIDLVEKESQYDTLSASSDGPGLEPPRPSEGSVAAVADMIESSERPVVVAGRGAALAGAREPLEALGERTGALLTTSAVGNGLFAGNPYSLGIAGGFSSPLAARLLAQADLVLAFGAALNRWTTRHGRLFPPETRVAQVDLDEEAMGALYRADVGVVGDAAATARAVVEELDRRGVRRQGFRGEGLAREIAHQRWRDEPYEDRGANGYVDPRAFSIALDDLLPPERTVAVDSGHFMGYPAMYLDVPDERAFAFAQGFQSVGLGLANAIGAGCSWPWASWRPPPGTVCRWS